jgi:nicotinamidase-related amidase
MSHPNRDLHGSAPDKSPVVLLLIDVINALDFPEAEQLLPDALAAARQLAALKRRCAQVGIPSVYVNDNFGRWRSDFRAYVDHCLSNDVLGRPLVELLQPNENDYFVLKPKHSGFYSTSLELLLEHLAAQAVILTGIAGNICVLFTANDAYLRDYQLIVPSDCVASNTRQENEHALSQMRDILKADTRPSAELDLDELIQPLHASQRGASSHGGESRSARATRTNRGR